MFGIIYKIVNKINGKLYVGQTWDTLKHRFNNHKYGNKQCIKLSRAIAKYGTQNFDIESILIAHTQEVLDYWEIYFIKNLDTIANGYNIREGGSRGKHSLESRRKMSEVRKGIIFSEETKRRIKMNNRAGEFDVRKKISLSNAAKTTLYDIKEIKKLAKSGIRQTEIAKKFSISKSYVSKIVNNVRRNF